MSTPTPGTSNAGPASDAGAPGDRAADADATVRATELVVTYGSYRALDGVTLSLRPGVTGLLGPNGAGKTTLLRLLATVDAPAGGEVEILGRRTDRTDERTEVRRRLGYLPQEPGFHRGFTVFEFIDYVAILKEHLVRRERHDEVRRVIRLVGLEEKAHQKIRKLSGGMRRRVALAQALLGDPDVVILDEPTAGLDPELRMWFRDLVSQLGERRTVLLSTHQTDDITAVAQRVVVMSKGRTEFDGTPPALAELAAGRTWTSGERDPNASVGWRTAEGTYRHLGDPPTGAQLAAPTIEDGYLLLIGPQARAEVAA